MAETELRSVADTAMWNQGSLYFFRWCLSSNPQLFPGENHIHHCKVRKTSRITQCELLGKCKSKPQWGITSHPLEWLLPKRQEITSVGEDVEKKEPSYAVGGNVTGVATMENGMKIPQKIKNRTIKWLSYSTSGYLAKEYENTFKKIYTPLCSSQHYLKQPRYKSNLSAHWWMNG